MDMSKDRILIDCRQQHTMRNAAVITKSHIVNPQSVGRVVGVGLFIQHTALRPAYSVEEFVLHGNMKRITL